MHLLNAYCMKTTGQMCANHVWSFQNMNTKLMLAKIKCHLFFCNFCIPNSVNFTIKKMFDTLMFLHPQV